MQTKKCHRIFSFSTAVTLVIKSRSPNYNQFFVMSQLFIYIYLVRIQTLVHKILCRQESEMSMMTPMRSIPKTICPPYLRSGDINTLLNNTCFYIHVHCNIPPIIFIPGAYHIMPGSVSQEKILLPLSC